MQIVNYIVVTIHRIARDMPVPEGNAILFIFTINYSSKTIVQMREGDKITKIQEFFSKKLLHFYFLYDKIKQTK